jgi:PGF-CTERM protein
VTQIDVPEPDRAATIRTRVTTERLEEIGADAGELRVNRFDEDAGEWQPLDTEVVETADERVVLEAETPGFSFFSVSAVGDPEAVVDAPSEITAGEEITLDGSDSSDEYGEIIAYEWTVDGETLTGETVTTTLETAGEISVELTVENDAGETDSETVTVSVLEPDTETGATDTSTGTGPGTETAPADQPGFGVALTRLALFVAALLARRRV